MNEEYYNILLKYYKNHYKEPSKEIVIKWYNERYNLPSELWIIISKYLHVKNIILLSRCSKYLYHSLNEYTSSLKNSIPFGFIKFSIGINNNNFSYINNFKIPIYLTDKTSLFQFIRRNNGLYVKISYDHLYDTLYSYFKNNDNLDSQKIEYHRKLVTKLQDICRTKKLQEIKEIQHKKYKNIRYTSQTHIKIRTSEIYLYFTCKFDDDLFLNIVQLILSKEYITPM